MLNKTTLQKIVLVVGASSLLVLPSLAKANENRAACVASGRVGMFGNWVVDIRVPGSEQPVFSTVGLGGECMDVLGSLKQLESTGVCALNWNQVSVAMKEGDGIFHNFDDCAEMVEDAQGE